MNNLTNLTNPAYFLVFFTVFCLACYRIVSLLSAEDGPKMVFHRLRVFAGVEMNGDGKKKDEQPRGSLAYGLTCPWCCSVWVATALFALYLIVGDFFFLLFPLAASTVVIKLDKVVNEYRNGKEIELLELKIAAMELEQSAKRIGNGSDVKLEELPDWYYAFAAGKDDRVYLEQKAQEAKKNDPECC